MSKKLLTPEQVKDWLTRRYNHQHRAWLEGGGEWPLEVGRCMDALAWPRRIAA